MDWALDRLLRRVRELREGDDATKIAAAQSLGGLAVQRNDFPVAIAEAGGVPLLVELLRDGSAEAKQLATEVLFWLAYTNPNYQVLIAEAGAIVSLLELLRLGDVVAKSSAGRTLHMLTYNNDANAVAIAVAIGLEALIELARRGRVTVDDESLVHDAGVPAKRKAALVVAALDSLPDSVPRDIKDVIAPYL